MAKALVHAIQAHGIPLASIIGMNRSSTVLLCAAVMLMAFPSAQAHAGEFSAVLNGKSFHLNSSYDWNEDNFGFGVEYEFASETKWKKIVMANGFRDSADEMSYMVGGGLHRQLYHTDRFSGFYVSAGLNAFLMTRSDVDNSDPFPGILPSITVGNEHAGLNLTYLPKKAVESMLKATMNDPTVSGIIFLQLKFSLDKILP